MRRTLGSLLLTSLTVSVLLTGCGSDSASDQRAGDGASESAPTGPVDFTEVAMVSSTAAGGKTGARAVVLDDAQAVAAFSEQFRSSAMEARLTKEVERAEVPAGRTLVGAVVAIGCDVPPGVAVRRLPDGLAITPLKVADPLPECLAPVTTVALVAVDSGEV